MRIAQINLGLISIPPKSWGAIEKVIWNYKLQLEKLGHTVDVVFPWEIYEGGGKTKYDIVHFHAANQAIEEWNNHNIPYVFSMHDHHVVRYGKLSTLYANNFLAMKKSVASITYAEYLLDYFDTTDKLFYIPHGADTSIYVDKGIKHPKHKLLCVANNGYANDPYYDRKGFRYAIEAAKELDLEITIVGPDNNKNFFSKNEDLLQYEKLKFIKDPTEEKLVDIYNDHTIFLHPSELEAGQPNLTLVEALACGLPIVGTYDGRKPLEGLVKCIRNTSDVVNNIKKVINNYDHYKDLAHSTAKKYDWSVVVKELNDFYHFVVSVKDNFTRDDMRKHVIDAYTNSEIIHKDNAEPQINYSVNFNGREGNPGCFFEMKCLTEKKINVEFIDRTDGPDRLVWSLPMTSNRWAVPPITYYRNWRIRVTGDDEQVFDYNAEGKNVLIAFHSSSLGDSIAWIPYVEEFRIKHKCVMYCSTHQNHLFESVYKDIIFIKPDTYPENMYAFYPIGWFSPPWGGDRSRQPNDYRIVPLQQTASDILGLPYFEIRPKIAIPDKERPYVSKYVVIAEHSTANAKHWHHAGGWQSIVDYLNSKGLKVVVISRQSTTLRNVLNETGEQTIEKRINQIKHSEFMITIGSGLAWVAWALGKKVVMISGFSKPFCEFKSNCIRVHNDKVCNGCFNDLRYEFDRGKWDWCPAQKEGSEDMFICSKSITPAMVIESIEKNGLIKRE
jgi:autotransporter strand-loop-strand O-heptosyltransferase